MKISDTGSVGKAGPSSKKKKAGAPDGSFGRILDSSGTGGSSEASSVHGPAVITSLLAIPAVNPDESANQKERERGHALLDELDQLKLDLLSGHLSPERAKRITNQLRTERAGTLDQQLLDIIDAIELRCEVELAKLEKAQK